MMTSITTAHYPKTNNPNIVLDPHISSNINSNGRGRLAVQCVHYTTDGYRCDTLGYIFKGSVSNKWTAVFYGDKVQKRQGPVATKLEAVAKFDKLLAGMRGPKIDRILENA